MSILTRRCFPAICALAVSFAFCPLPVFGQQPTPLTGANTLGVFRGSGEWIVNVSGTHTYQGGGDDDVYSFGMTNDIPVMGNWTGANPAVLQMGVFRGGYWYLDMNNNQMWDGGDTVVSFGEAGDIPVVGDWNHDGNLHIGVVRPSTDGSNTLWWYVQTGCAPVNGVVPAVCDYDANNTSRFSWGMIGTINDTPVVGDWDGSGTLRVGVVQAGSGNWYVNLASCQGDVFDCNSSTGAYSSPDPINYASSSGIPVVGYWEWNVQNFGYMGPGTFNGGTWSAMGGPATSLTNSSTPYATWNYGEGSRSNDIPVLGPWSNPADNLHPAPTADALSISINGNNVGNTGGAPPGVTASFTFTFHDAAFGQNEIQWGAVGLVNNSSGTMFCELGWSAPTYQPALFLYPDSGDSYAGGGSASTYNTNVSDPNFCTVSALGRGINERSDGGDGDPELYVQRECNARHLQRLGASV